MITFCIVAHLIVFICKLLRLPFCRLQGPFKIYEGLVRSNQASHTCRPFPFDDHNGLFKAASEKLFSSPNIELKGQIGFLNNGCLASCLSAAVDDIAKDVERACTFRDKRTTLFLKLQLTLPWLAGILSTEFVGLSLWFFAVDCVAEALARSPQQKFVAPRFISWWWLLSIFLSCGFWKALFFLALKLLTIPVVWFLQCKLCTVSSKTAYPNFAAIIALLADEWKPPSD